MAAQLTLERVVIITLKLAFGVGTLTLLASVLLWLFSPFAVYHGIDLRPPGENEAEWHLGRISWFVQDAGWEHIVIKHREALIAMGEEAVPTLIDQAIHGHNKHARTRAANLLGKIGPVAKPLVAAAVDDPPLDGRIKADVARGRLLYAQFAAFHDWDAFEAWLDYASEVGEFALTDSDMGYRIQEFWNDSMPWFVERSADGYHISPEFVEWCKHNRQHLEAAEWAR